MSDPATPPSDSLTIATYNIRCRNPNDGINAWANRCPIIIPLIRRHQFDILSGQEAFADQAPIIAGAAPYLIMGDFNADQRSEPYRYLLARPKLADARDIASLLHATTGTFNSTFNADQPTDSRIDHIFLTAAFTVPHYAFLTDSYANGRYPSDHFPVVIHCAL